MTCTKVESFLFYALVVSSGTHILIWVGLDLTGHVYLFLLDILVVV